MRNYKIIYHIEVVSQDFHCLFSHKNTKWHGKLKR